jgi:cytochrome b pre-mRNA-processing protein 3
MLQWIKRRAERNRTAEKLYGSVVTAARQPFFYEELGVPDTPEGRFELVALHLFLALEGLRARPPADADLIRRTIEAFVSDMDDCMREMGVGDLTVPKKVKRAAAAFYERAAAYRRGLTADGPLGLATCVDSYLFGGSGSGAADALAGYMYAMTEALKAEPFEALLARGALTRLIGESGTKVS